ncbi:MAG: GTPase HflX [Dehalococcoidales bacterium]|nr:GTPase HflX [Dehalococcoidales bacterium]
MKEKAFLAAVATRRRPDQWSAEESLAELAQLAGTAGVEVVGKMIQNLTTPTKTHYLGQGKLTEILEIRNTVPFDTLIVDDELSPLQQRNLEDFLKIKIIDRVALILDIFAQRARTREGQLQVELAQHQYLFPRLTGQWQHLERLGGGIGTRGPGESQLETDRRLIRQKIKRLQEQTEHVRKHRDLYRQRRRKSGIPIIALVGYTNTGKSTLFNTLGRADVLVENKLFATLDPTTRRLRLPDNQFVLLTDTVGFIRKLPPAIVTAFRATLEELSEASILLHVVDSSLHNAVGQNQVVEDVLTELDLQDKPRITVLNKIDLLLDKNHAWTEEEAINTLSDKQLPVAENTVLISAAKGWGLKRLLELINRVLVENTTPWTSPQMPSSDIQ